MYVSVLVCAIIEGFPTLSLTNHSVKPKYVVIKETHHLLMLNTASVESVLGRLQNGYLGLVLPPIQYTRLATAAFKRPPDPGRTATVPEWTSPGE